MVNINIIYIDQPTKNRIFNPIKKMQRRIYFVVTKNTKMKLNYLEQVLLYIRNSVLFLFSAAILMAQVSTTVDKGEKNDGAKVELNKFVVTGVFNGINKQQAKTAISTLDFSDIEKIIPVSALDLLSFVPGVQVNTAQGIVRGAIRSRGLNGNTQTFISIMEDGLPVTATTYDNYAHDYFLRADSTIGQLEVLRGGSAAVFGPNAPGGIFNYISKTGGEFYSGQVSASYGLQGNGKLPYYRTDLSVGGPLGNGLFYHVGGYYQNDYGSQDVGYMSNRGGQLKANIVKKFANGSFMFYVKLLHDRNGFYGANTPVTGWVDPKIISGFTNVDSVIIPATSFEYQTGPNTSRHWDSTQGMLSIGTSVGLKFETKFGDSWTLSNNIKFSNNENDWGFANGAPYFKLNAAYMYGYIGTSGIPGTYTLTDTSSGKSAIVNSITGSDYTIISNNLPAQPNLPDAILRQLAYNKNYINEELMDQFSVTKTFNNMSFTLGGYFCRSGVDYNNGFAGAGFSTFTPTKHMLNITFNTLGGTSAGGNTIPAGTAVQVTNPQGFTSASNGSFLGRTIDVWLQEALFFGQRWDFADKWNLDWGVRGEHVQVTAHNSTGTVYSRSTTGGVDKNKNTLYDNTYATIASFYDVDRTMNTFSYSGAVGYEINKSNTTYFRISSAEKSPELSSYTGLTNSVTAPSIKFAPNVVTQYELGYKFVKPRYSFSIAAYHSMLEATAGQLLIVDPTSTSTFQWAFSPNPNQTENKGIEFESDFRFNNNFSLRTMLTLQKGKQIASWSFSQPKGPGPLADAVLSNSSSGLPAADIAETLAMVAPSYTNGRLFAQTIWRYTGDRKADGPNSFTLPGYSQTDLLLQWSLTKRLALNFIVNNAFDGTGMVAFVGAEGGGVGAPAINPAFVAANPNVVYMVLPIQARAYFAKLTYKF